MQYSIVTSYICMLSVRCGEFTLVFRFIHVIESSRPEANTNSASTITAALLYLFLNFVGC